MPTMLAAQPRAARQQELVRLALAGDRFAASDLFREVEKMAFAVARLAADRFKLRGGEATVDELAGAALAKLLTNLRSYSPAAGAVSTWAYVVLFRAANSEAARQATALRRHIALPDATGDGLSDPLSQLRKLSDLVPDDWCRAAVLVLTVREREIVARRFGLGSREPETLEEIGRSLGVTRQRALQLARRALRKMAAALKLQAA